MKALKAIDSRENALYQLNALILCTPVQETLFQPSRPADPAPLSSSTSHTGFQRLRAKAGMALAPALSSRSGTPHGVMTNAREATKMAQKLAEDLQLAGIQCVEAMVEWMLEAGAKAAYVDRLHRLSRAHPKRGSYSRSLALHRLLMLVRV